MSYNGLAISVKDDCWVMSHYQCLFVCGVIKWNMLTDRGHGLTVLGRRILDKNGIVDRRSCGHVLNMPREPFSAVFRVLEPDILVTF